MFFFGSAQFLSSRDTTLRILSHIFLLIIADLFVLRARALLPFERERERKKERKKGRKEGRKRERERENERKNETQINEQFNSSIVWSKKNGTEKRKY